MTEHKIGSPPLVAEGEPPTDTAENRASKHVREYYIQRFGLYKWAAGGENKWFSTDLGQILSLALHLTNISGLFHTIRGTLYHPNRTFLVSYIGYVSPQNNLLINHVCVPVGTVKLCTINIMFDASIRITLHYKKDIQVNILLEP